MTRPTEDGERLSDGIQERAREGSVCHPGCRSKRALSPASLRGRPHQSHRLAADSIDHLQSFIHPIKMLSVHITFVFLWWTQLLLHKDPVVMNIQFYHFCLLSLLSWTKIRHFFGSSRWKILELKFIKYSPCGWRQVVLGQIGGKLKIWNLWPLMVLFTSSLVCRCPVNCLMPWFLCCSGVCLLLRPQIGNRTTPQSVK